MTLAQDPRSAAAAAARGVTAVLGPTNTGKTHLAIERMLAHSSGVIGLPLRLLAREVYGRAIARVGADQVALITGEEKIKPPGARYWVCTVEAMPRDLDVAFMAVDEIQLAADLERGHVFTDRLLNARGREETLLLGALTMRPMVEKLLPGASVVTRPRLSQLTYAGDKKLTRLPARSAVVAFSAEEVYAIAELIRRQRGGAAVVLGALSPRTRNAQVALYQAGDVDFLVATDAIGMGLNLDVDHVAFASIRKFDGFQFRDLNPAELGQIAGRAGRHTRDGTFGVTARVDPFEPDRVRALESHDFEPLKILQWRNSALDFSSLGALRGSLAELPQQPGLTRAPLGEDALVLDMAASDPEIAALAGRPRGVERLWEACQVPDYRKSAPAAHADLVFTLYRFLMEQGKVPADWLAVQIDQADRTEGDIDTLSHRIAHVRTWTFVANRPDWLADPAHWQGVAREVEDKLSDALHERLTQRFVDRRTSVLMRRLRENASMEAEINAGGDVLVEGEFVGHLSGFRFAPDASAEAIHGKALRTAAQKALVSEIERRAARLAASPDSVMVLSSDGHLRWEGAPIARLTAGDRVLSPRLVLLADTELTGPQRDRVAERLERWFEAHKREVLKPLLDLEAGEGLEGMARGVAFQVVEGLGVLERARVAEEVRGLDQGARAKLRALGLRFGAYHLYLPLLLKPAPRGLLVLLWALKSDQDLSAAAALTQLTSSGRTSLAVDPALPKPLYGALGFRVAGARAVRIDMLERLADVIRPALAWRQGTGTLRPEPALAGGFRVTGAMTSLLGCSGEDFANVLRSLGYRAVSRTVSRVELDAWKAPPPAVGAAPAAAEGVAEQPADPARPATAVAPQETEGPAADATGAEPQVEGPDTDGAPPEASAEGGTLRGQDGSSVGQGQALPRLEGSEEAGEPVEGGAGPDRPETVGPAAVATDHAEDATVLAEVPVGDTIVLEAVPAETAEADAAGATVPAEPAEADAAGEAVPAEAAEADAAAPTAEPPGAEPQGQAPESGTEAGASPASPEPAVGLSAEAAASPTAAETVEIEIWYPGRRSEERRPRHETRRQDRPERPSRRGDRPAERGAERPAGEAAAGAEERPQGDRRQPPRRGDRPRRPDERGPEHRAERQDRPRPPGQGRPPRPEGSRPEKRERAPDPNSPFAALAQLKADLEARSKRGS